MSIRRSIVWTLLSSAVLAGLGAWAGASYAMHRIRPATPMHELVHDKLHLTDDQQRRIEGLEREHSARQEALKTEMRAANSDLAKAIGDAHAYTPQVQEAIDRFHHAMGELQKETILHVLAMREVLTPAQAAQFDETVARSLTEDGK